MVALPIGEVRGTVGAPRRRLVGRFSSGHLVMIVAGLLGMVLGIAALRHEPEGVEVAVAAHEIRAGETVTAADFREHPRADAATAARHVGAVEPRAQPAWSHRDARPSHRVSSSFDGTCGRVRRKPACAR